MSIWGRQQRALKASDEPNVECYKCHHLFNKNYAIKVAFSSYYVSYGSRELAFCPTCKPAYVRFIHTHDGKAKYYKEVECDESGKVLVS